jgi:hypothetical protein
MLINRPILFFCFVLSGLSLDAYWSWYSFHFAAACSESGNMVPTTWLLFTAASLIPATGSLIFRSNLTYFFVCLAIWLLYMVLEIYLIAEGTRFEGFAGINCYRDVGTGGVISFYFTIIFSAAIIAVTLAFGTAWLLRKLLHRPAAQ